MKTFKQFCENMTPEARKMFLHNLHVPPTSSVEPEWLEQLESVKQSCEDAVAGRTIPLEEVLKRL